MNNLTEIDQLYAKIDLGSLGHLRVNFETNPAGVRESRFGHILIGESHHTPGFGETFDIADG